MRMSRRAVLKATGVAWNKYEYVHILSKDLVRGELEEEKYYSKGIASSIDGYEEFDLVVRHGEYYDYYAVEVYGHTTLTEGNPGTVFDCSDDGTTLYIYEFDGDSYETFTRSVISTYKNEIDKWVTKSHFGTVRAKEGQYPDADRGYTFVKIDGEYTIMTDGKKYYAYKLMGVSK